MAGDYAEEVKVVAAATTMANVGQIFRADNTVRSVVVVYGVRCARATAPAGIGADHR